MKTFAKVVLIDDNVYLKILTRKGISYFLINDIADEDKEDKIIKSIPLTKRFLIDLIEKK